MRSVGARLTQIESKGLAVLDVVLPSSRFTKIVEVAEMTPEMV